MIKKHTVRLLSVLLLLSLASAALSGCLKSEPRRVLLISVDGLRADAVQNTEYGKHLLSTSAYSLAVRTVSPSITLPCHMSMVHSVTPNIHGVTTNTYTPSEFPKKGIFEACFESNKTSAFFYNWGPLGDIAPEGTTAVRQYIPGETVGWEEANRMIGDACIEHIQNAPTDFLFLYLGFLDEWGHKYGWLSEEYYYALNESFALLDGVINAARAQSYTVILTSDHGGHDKGHGSDMAEDMTVPLFIIGEGFSAKTDLGPRSILDISPTVADILKINPPDHWQGTAITE